MKCAVYVRVSTDTIEQKTSLQNQVEIFNRYILEQGWDLFNVYVDIESGTKEDRKQFTQMLKDAEDNKFNVILAKELSRLARNVKTSYKIKELAEKKGINIITLDGAVNTLIGNTQMFGLFAWLYEQEVQNTSRRVKAALNNRAKNGLFKGSIPPYGYNLKDGKLYIRDDYTPSIVKRIFKEYLQGFGQDLIAKRLWQDGIPTPAMVAGKKNAGSVWHGSSVNLILNNPNYIGDLVQSKTCTVSVTSSIRKKNNKEDWIVVKNTHTPIIERQEFNAVQNLINSRKKLLNKVTTQTHLFTNVLFCADCKKGMHYKKNRKGYVCGKYDKWGKKACTDHIVREQELENIILADINKFLEIIGNKNLKSLIEKKILQQKLKIEKELNFVQKKIDVLSTTKNNALTKFVNDLITKQDYNFLIEKNNKELTELLKQQQILKLAVSNFKDNNLLEELNVLQAKYIKITKLTPEILNKFIEKIEIKSDGAPKIYYRFSGSSIYFFNFFNHETHSTWLELMALMSYYFARLWKHISSIFGTIGRREHIQLF